jgi:hypothetical protein
VNAARLAQIAAWLEAGGWDGVRGFDMRASLGFNDMDPFHPARHITEGHHCAIDGAAVSFFGDLENAATSCKEARTGGWFADEDYVIRHAARVLELGRDTALALFLPSMSKQWNGSPMRGPDIDDFNDPAWAARVIRKLIATGVVDWSGCSENPTNGN